MPRLFVGARVSVATANAIAACAEMLARRAKDARVDLRWVAPASYHVTLKFLGATRDDAVGAVRDAVEAACVGAQPMKLRCARLGAFPSLDKASVLWAGIDEVPALAELAKRIDEACARLGYPAEKRAFHPHVTIARVGAAGDRSIASAGEAGARVPETRSLRELVLPLAEQMFSESRVDGVTLFESVTKSSGPVYSELHRIRFKTPETAEKRQTPALELTDETDDGWPRGHQ